MSECAHPEEYLEVQEDGSTVCQTCGTVLAEKPSQVAQLAGDEPPPPLGLKHITWNPSAQYASRPYTPEEIELEMMGTIDLLERGTTWLVGADQARYEAKMTFDLERARKLLEAPGRSQEMREAWAMLETESLYREWQRMEIIYKTRERAMHNVRAKLSGLQSIARSVGASLQVGGGYR